MSKTLRIGCLLFSSLFALAACSEKDDSAPVTSVSEASPDPCVGNWAAAYREEQGADSVITTDQLTEWQSWCNEGKMADASDAASASSAQANDAPAPAAPVASAPVASAPAPAPAPADPAPAAPAPAAPTPAAPAPPVVVASDPASAGMDEAAIEPYLKKQGCMKCHAIDRDKKGPAYKKVAAKYKDKPDGEAQVIKNISEGPKVTFDDGSEEEHSIIDAKDPADLKAIAKWILSR